MNPVAGGWTSHKMRSDDYESTRRAAIAQSGKNAYIQGVQDSQKDPLGGVKGTRGKYGDTRVKPGDLFATNFSQSDHPGNQSMEDLPNQTGSTVTQASSTNVPQQDPDAMETSALENRLENMRKGGQGFPGLNNRKREV